MHWYLAQVRPNADQIARRNLERQQFRTFQPLERRTRVRSGKFLTLHRPYFPGYLFVSHGEAVAPWHLVNSTHGVVRLVAFAGKPAPVPEAVIAELEAACGADGVMAPGDDFQPGAQVEVTSGAFTSFVGEIERLTPDCRVLVLLDFMGKRTRVNLPAASLRPESSTARQLEKAAS